MPRGLRRRAFIWPGGALVILVPWVTASLDPAKGAAMRIRPNSVATAAVVFLGLFSASLVSPGIGNFLLMTPAMAQDPFGNNPSNALATYNAAVKRFEQV